MKRGRKLSVAAAVVGAAAAVVMAADAAAMAVEAADAAEAVVDAAEIVETAETAGKRPSRFRSDVFILGTPLETFLRNPMRQVCACRLYFLLQHLT
jgi:hypothetical protein